MTRAIPIQAAPRGAVVTVVGPPESGKSQLLWHWYVQHCPRILSADVVGDPARFDPAARQTFGLEATVAELRDCAELERWHVAASLERDELEELFWILCPHRKSEGTHGFGRAVGGLAIACDELLHLAPNPLGKSSRVKVAYLQYRHHWLSLFGATQHAPDCDPCTRAGDRLVALRTTESLSLAAIGRATSREIADRVAELPQFHSVTCLKSAGRAYLADGAYRIYDVLDYRGRSLSSGADSTTAGLFPAAAQSAGGDVMPRPPAGQRQARA